MANPATMTLDTSRLRQLNRDILHHAPGARDAALSEVVEQAVRFMDEVSPRETNAYVVGWQRAANQAGLGPFPVAQIRPSPRAKRIEKRLREQLRYWQSRIEMFEKTAQERLRTGGVTGVRGVESKINLTDSDKSIMRRYAAFENIPDRWPSYRKAVRQRDRALEHLKRFLESGGEAVEIRASRHFSDTTLTALTTVRINLGQGFGRRFTVGGALFIELVNRNPHGRFVERNHRIAARAAAMGATLGARAIRGRYLRELQFRDALAQTGSAA